MSDDRAHVLDILLAARTIRQFVTGVAQQLFLENLEKQSGGRITVKRFPGSQMGPVQQHYDFARTGQADVAWFLHGATPGRFPLTELVNLPYLIGSAEIGTKVLNDKELRARYLDAEHKGIKVLLLLTHQPGNVHTTRKAIRSVDDMKGLRIRKNVDSRKLPIPVEYTFAREVARESPVEPDGIYIPCGGWGSVHNIRRLEDDLGKPVITWFQVMIWWTLKQAGVRAPIAGFGKLLESLRA